MNTIIKRIRKKDVSLEFTGINKDELLAVDLIETNNIFVRDASGDSDADVNICFGANGEIELTIWSRDNKEVKIHHVTKKVKQELTF